MWARKICVIFCLFFVMYEVSSQMQNQFIQQVNQWKKQVDEFNCRLYKWQLQMFPDSKHSGPDPCSLLQGQLDPLPVGYDPHAEMASIKPPDILQNIFNNKNKNPANKTEGTTGIQKAPVDQVSGNPNNAEKPNNGQLFPNNPFLNNGQIPNTNGGGSGVVNIQNPNGQLQPFNPYPPNWNFPNNGFNPNGQWNPNNGYPNYPLNPNGQYPYPAQYNPNQNQFYPNGQPMWGTNGNFPNQGGFVGTNTWGNNQGSMPGPFPNTNQPNNGQNPNWSFYPNQQYPGQVNNGQYPNVNGVPNWTPNQNPNQGPGKNQPQFLNPWGFNPNQASVQNGQYPNTNGQKPNQGTNTNGQPVWGSNPNGNQGSGQNNLFPSNNQNQGSVKYPNENGQPIWNNQNPNQGSGQNGQFPIVNKQPVWGPNTSQNEKDSTNTAGGIVFPGAESQGPGGRSILNNNNGTYMAPTLLSTTSTTPASSSICNTKTTSTTTPIPSVTSSSQEIKPNVTEATKEILTSVAPATSTTPKIKPNCRRMSHSSKRRKNNDDYEDDDIKEKESDLPYCDESTDRPETTVTVKDGKSLIGGVKSNCPVGFIADTAGVCREQY